MCCSNRVSCLFGGSQLVPRLMIIDIQRSEECKTIMFSGHLNTTVNGFCLSRQWANEL